MNMFKLPIYIDGKLVNNIDISKNTTVKNVKDLLKDYKDYNIKLHLNTGEKVPVFDNSKYDMVTLESVWNKMPGFITISSWLTMSDENLISYLEENEENLYIQDILGLFDKYKLTDVQKYKIFAHYLFELRSGVF